MMKMLLYLKKLLVNISKLHNLRDLLSSKYSSIKKLTMAKLQIHC